MAKEETRNKLGTCLSCITKCITHHLGVIPPHPWALFIATGDWGHTLLKLPETCWQPRNFRGHRRSRKGAEVPPLPSFEKRGLWLFRANWMLDCGDLVAPYRRRVTHGIHDPLIIKQGPGSDYMFRLSD